MWCVSSDCVCGVCMHAVRVYIVFVQCVLVYHISGRQQSPSSPVSPPGSEVS